MGPRGRIHDSELTQTGACVGRRVPNGSLGIQPDETIADPGGIAAQSGGAVQRELSPTDHAEQHVTGSQVLLFQLTQTALVDLAVPRDHRDHRPLVGHRDRFDRLRHPGIAQPGTTVGGPPRDLAGLPRPLQRQCMGARQECPHRVLGDRCRGRRGPDVRSHEPARGIPRPHEQDQVRETEVGQE